MISQGSIVGTIAQTAVLQFSGGTTRAWVIPTELFFELFIATDNPDTTFDSGFGWIASSSFAGNLVERAARLGYVSYSYLSPCWFMKWCGIPGSKRDIEFGRLAFYL